MPNMFTLVLQIAVVLGVCRLVGNLFLKIRQPRVVAQESRLGDGIVLLVVGSLD